MNFEINISVKPTSHQDLLIRMPDLQHHGLMAVRIACAAVGTVAAALAAWGTAADHPLVSRCDRGRPVGHLQMHGDGHRWQCAVTSAIVHCRRCS